jgi:uncharacterized surface protein with fasciclin (FAS1) repeats
VASKANLSYLIAFLNAENILQNSTYLNPLATRRDTTYFAPNTATVLTNIPSNITAAALNSLIEYHCVENLFYSTDLINGTVLTTLTGAKAIVTVDDDGSIYVNTAKVIGTNYLLYNGVLHLIDKYDN